MLPVQEQISKLLTYTSKSEDENEVLNYFIFCYYGQMSLKTLSQLRYGDRIPGIYANSEMTQIIGKYGNEPRHIDTFIFPILNNYTNEDQQYLDYHHYKTIAEQILINLCNRLNIDVTFIQFFIT